MIKGRTPVLTVPSHKVTEHRVWQIDRDSIRWQEVAGPFFDAGGLCLALADLPNSKGSLHTPGFHRFYMILQGRMEFRLGRDTVTAESGQLVSMPAGFLTSKSGIGPVSVIYVLLDDIPLWAPLKSIGPSVRKYESADLLYILVSSIINASRTQDIYSLNCARENSETLVRLLKREMHQSSNEWTSSRMKLLTDLIETIRKQPDLKWDQPTMAKKVNMSERNLTRVFKRVFNMPPTKMLITIRMDIAAQMLIKTDLPLSDIASAVGYESPFSFSRLFKKYTGISPQQYRDLPADQRHSAMSAARSRT